MINLGASEYLVGASPEMYVRVEGTRVEILSVYAAAVLVIMVVWITSGYVQSAHFRSLFGASVADLAAIVVGVVIGSGFAVRYAFRPNCPVLLRNVLLGPLGWPWLLFKRNIALVVSGWVALAIVASLPGAAEWLRSLAMVWARCRWPGVGAIVAIGLRHVAVANGRPGG